MTYLQPCACRGRVVLSIRTCSLLPPHCITRETCVAFLRELKRIKASIARQRHSFESSLLYSLSISLGTDPPRSSSFLLTSSPSHLLFSASGGHWCLSCEKKETARVRQKQKAWTFFRGTNSYNDYSIPNLSAVCSLLRFLRLSQHNVAVSCYC